MVAWHMKVSPIGRATRIEESKNQTRSKSHHERDLYASPYRGLGSVRHISPSQKRLEWDWVRSCQIESIKDIRAQSIETRTGSMASSGSFLFTEDVKGSRCWQTMGTSIIPKFANSKFFLCHVTTTLNPSMSPFYLDDIPPYDILLTGSLRLSRTST